MTVRNPDYLNLDVGMGLILQLTPAEAKEMIPKIKELYREKLEVAKVDLSKAYSAKKTFENSYMQLKLALDPAVARLGL